MTQGKAESFKNLGRPSFKATANPYALHSTNSGEVKKKLAKGAFGNKRKPKKKQKNT